MEFAKKENFLDIMWFRHNGVNFEVNMMIAEALKMFMKYFSVIWMTLTCDYKIVPRKILGQLTVMNTG